MVFLAVTDIISAVGLIASAAATAGYVRLSAPLRKKRIIFFLVTALVMLFYAGSFIGWSIYNTGRFASAHSFLRFCPLGTSFFYLQAIRFAADIYKGRIRRLPDINETLDYLLFFPRLVMGPVMTYSEHIQMQTGGKQSSERTGEGLGLFIIGLSKKLLLADTIGLVFAPLYGNLSDGTTLLMAWLTILAFALEFFFTVSGYGDMAKGIALCYGFEVPCSYKTPLLSGSLSRFGDEWNISVISWFKCLFRSMLRPGCWQYIVGTVAVWILAGMWYRPEPQIIIWGAYIGLWIGLDGYVRDKFRRVPSVINGTAFFLAMFLGWAFFSADSLAEGISAVGLLLGRSASIARAQDFYYIRSAGLIIVIAAYSATGNFSTVLGRLRRVPFLSRAIDLLGVIVQILLLLLCVVVLATNNDIMALQMKGVI